MSTGKAAATSSGRAYEDAPPFPTGGAGMTDLMAAIAKNRFVVFGRAGMDMFASPVGTKAEHAETFESGLGGLKLLLTV